MTPSICILPVAVAALTFGQVGLDLKLTGDRFPFPQDYTVLAENNKTQPGQTRVEAMTPSLAREQIFSATTPLP